MQIKQISARYLQEHDRILIRLKTTDGKEMRMWLTRRLTLEFWPALQMCTRELSIRKATLSTAHNPSLNRALADFEREKNLRQADLKTPFDETPAELPLGSDPLLITTVNMSAQKNGSLQLNWIEQLPHTSEHRNFQVILQASMYHGFSHLIDKAIDASGWGDSHALTRLDTTQSQPQKAIKPQYMN